MCQRAGRGARDPMLDALFVYVVEPKYFDDTNNKEQWKPKKRRGKQRAAKAVDRAEDDTQNKRQRTDSELGVVNSQEQRMVGPVGDSDANAPRAGTSLGSIRLENHEAQLAMGFKEGGNNIDEDHCDNDKGNEVDDNENMGGEDGEDEARDNEGGWKAARDDDGEETAPESGLGE